MNSKLPLVIVEKIIQNENNYLNIRHDFVQLKEDIYLYHKDLRSLLKTLHDNDFNPRTLHYIKNLNQQKEIKKTQTDMNLFNTAEDQKDEGNKEGTDKSKEAKISFDNNTPDNNYMSTTSKINYSKNDFVVEDTSNYLFSYMEYSINYLYKMLFSVLLSAREKAIVKGEMENFQWLDFSLKKIGCFSHFKENECHYECHFKADSLCEVSEDKDLQDLLTRHFDYFNNTKFNLSNRMKFLNNQNLLTYYGDYSLPTYLI